MRSSREHKIRDQEIKNYNEFGFIIQHNAIGNNTLQSLLTELDHLCSIDSEKKIVEENGAPCSLYIGLDDSKLISNLWRYPKLLSTVEDLLNSKVYLHQCKYNSKIGYFGSEIMWHQDFYYWHKLDGMPTSRVVTAALILDDVDYFNSPLWFISKSQSYVLDKDKKNIPAQSTSGVELSWVNTEKNKENTVVGDLRYTVEKDDLKKLIQQGCKPIPFLGKAGSIAYFHGNLIHASTKNISPWDRRMLFITYNSVENKLLTIKNPRAAFIANRNYSHLVKVNKF